MSKTEHMMSSCLGKVKHKSILAADYVLYQMKNYREMHIYPCKFCKSFHIGHIRKKKKIKL